MKLLIVALSSIFSTLLLLFLLVLPAIYGIDPTGFGAKLGLNATSVETKPTAGVGGGKESTSQAEISVKTVEKMAEQPISGVSAQSDAMLDEHNETFTLLVPPKQNLFFKIAMERDYELDYHWATDGKLLYAELRGQKQAAKANEFKVFGKIKGRKGKGFFIAPFNGTFTLYWENKSDQAVAIRLTAKGVFNVLSP